MIGPVRHNAGMTDPAYLRVLNVFNRNGRGVLGGVEAQLMAFRCRELSEGADDGQAALDSLRAQGYVETVPGSDSHLRLSAQGYAWLLSLPELPSAAAPKARGHGEYEMRARVLAIYRQQGIVEGGHLSSETLARYWEASGQRAGELRHALDVLLRDGFLRMGRFQKTLFRLQGAGARYLEGRELPDLALRHQPALLDSDRSLKTMGEEPLLLLGAHVFDVEEGLPPEGLELPMFLYALEKLGLPHCQAFLAADLLHRREHADLDATGTLTLTDTGLDLVVIARTQEGQFMTTQALDKADGGAHS